MLDVISVSLVEARPIEFQRENWLLDPTVRWLKVGRIGWDGLCTLKQRTLGRRPGSLWINGYNTSAGVNDCVPVEHKEMLVDSLKLIRVDGVTIVVNPAHPKSNDPRPIVRARFRHVNSEYALKVTDPVYEEKFCAKGQGNYRLGESFLTVSLSEEFRGNFYKLVAAIIERADAEPGGRR